MNAGLASRSLAASRRRTARTSRQRRRGRLALNGAASASFQAGGSPGAVTNASLQVFTADLGTSARASYSQASGVFGWSRT